jgi:hypothetical protein
MPRPSLIVGIALTSVAMGCATSAPLYQPSCSGYGGRCDRSDVISAAIGLGALALGAGIYVLATRPPRAADAPPPASPGPTREVLGEVRWESSGAVGHALSVSFRAAQGPVVQTTITDQAGQFRFPFPRKPGFYTVSVATDDATGETSVWLQDRPPDRLEVVLRPR